MNTANTTKNESQTRLARVVNRSFDLMDNVMDNVDQLVTGARKDGLSVAREFVGLQVRAAERIMEIGDAAISELRHAPEAAEATPEATPEAALEAAPEASAEESGEVVEELVPDPAT
jgi:hypothetical protein